MRYAPWEMDFPLTSPPWLATSIHPYPAALTHPIAGQSQDIDAFVIVMIGGMGSFVGTAIGSLLVGVSQTFGNFYFPDYALGATYALMILILLIRPGGLFGEQE